MEQEERMEIEDTALEGELTEVYLCLILKDTQQDQLVMEVFR